MQREMAQMQMDNYESPDQQEARLRDRYAFQQGESELDREARMAWAGEQPDMEGYNKITSYDGELKYLQKPQQAGGGRGGGAGGGYGTMKDASQEDINKIIGRVDEMLIGFGMEETTGYDIPANVFRSAYNKMLPQIVYGEDGTAYRVPPDPAAAATDIYSWMAFNDKSVLGYLDKLDLNDKTHIAALEEIRADVQPMIENRMPISEISSAVQKAVFKVVKPVSKLDRLPEREQAVVRGIAGDLAPRGNAFVGATGLPVGKKIASLLYDKLVQKYTGKSSGIGWGDVAQTFKDTSPYGGMARHAEIGVRGGMNMLDEKKSWITDKIPQDDTPGWMKTEGTERKSDTRLGYRQGDMVTFEGKRGRIISTGGLTGPSTNDLYRLVVRFEDGTVIEVPENEVSKEMPYNQNYDMVNNAWGN